MTIDGAQVLVNAPSRTPLPYGLLSVSQVPVDTGDADPHWRNGIRFETDACSMAALTLDSCAVTGTATLNPTDGWGQRGATPITAFTMPVCSPIGRDDDYESRVVAVLTSGEARAIEREFWTGAQGTLPHLAANTAVTGTGFDTSVVMQTAVTQVAPVTGSVDIIEGVALLEQALAECYGNEGVIHVPQIALAHLKSEDLIDVDGTRLRSPAGHLVAAGAGYPGTGPTGTSPGGTGIWWLYATGAITVRRSAIEVTSSFRQAVNTAKNDIYLVAERTYVISWDCCHFGVPVRMGGEISGAVGVAT